MKRHGRGPILVAFFFVVGGVARLIRRFPAGAAQRGGKAGTRCSAASEADCLRY